MPVGDSPYEPIIRNPNPNPNNTVSKIHNDDDLEEGEIFNEADSSSRNLQKEIANKHPLENSWTFWFANRSPKTRSAVWEDASPIYTFSTIEDFWSLYNYVNKPSKFSVAADFHCFKEKIEPKWEDPICASGGNWTMNFVKGKSDMCWLYTLLAMIGEQFDHGDEICGAVVNVRNRQEKVSLWTKNASNEAAQVSIGKQWKEFVDSKENIGFIFHEDSKIHDKNAKSRYSA